MKRISMLLAVVVAIGLWRCTENNITLQSKSSTMLKESQAGKDGNMVDSNAPLPATWLLTSVEGLSDQEKYLGALLTILSDNTYTITSNTGKVVAGTYTRTGNDRITLGKGIFEGFAYDPDKGQLEGEPVDYSIVNLNSSLLQLEQHYTLDNKNGYVEYHWKKQ